MDAFDRPFDPSIDKPRPNPDGSVSTELTRTVQTPEGGWTNVPSLWWKNAASQDYGKLSDDELAEKALQYEQSTGKRFPRFDSVDAAVSAAKARSAQGGGEHGAITKPMMPWEKYGTAPAVSTAVPAIAAPKPWEKYGAEPADVTPDPAEQIEPPPAPEGPAPVPSWSEIPGQALANAPSSALTLGKNMVEPIIHPVQTGRALYDLALGTYSKIAKNNPAVSSIPGIGPLLAGVNTLQSPEERTRREGAADAVGKFLVDRYGSVDNLKKTLATDPVGALADISIVLTGGSAAAARLPGVAGKVAEVAGTVGRTVDPVLNATKAIGVAGKTTGKALTYPLGLTTGATPRNISMAARAGAEGNKTFVSQMRGTADINQPVDLAETALRQISQERGAAYNAGMTGVKADKAQLSFTPINKIVNDARDMVQFHGLPKSAEAMATYLRIEKLVKAWQARKPRPMVQPNGSIIVARPHRTAEGLDALKQAIGEIRQGTEYGTLSRKVADSIYNSVKAEVARQAPEYAKTMAGYAEASDKLKELSKTFSLGEKATNDTKLRKLTSIMRDNVNTNFGARAKLGEELARKQPNLPYAIAGQTLSSPLPRGLGRVVAGGEAGLGLGAIFLHPAAIPAVATALAASSPRLVGEAAYLAGKGSKALRSVAKPSIGRAAVQLGRLPEIMTDVEP